MKPSKFTYRTGSKYPISDSGKVQWTSDREEAMKLARAFDAHEFLELNSKGIILNVIPLSAIQSAMKKEGESRNE